MIVSKKQRSPRARRRILTIFSMASGIALLGVIAACVGDDPGANTPPTTPNNDSGTPTGNDTGTGPSTADSGAGGSDTGTNPGVDTGAPIQDAAVDVNCNLSTPMVFPGVADAGPFCNLAGPGGTNHCAFNDHCCRGLDQNTQQCATGACGAGLTDVACANSAECDPGLVCCGFGKVRTNACPYVVVEEFKKSVCAPSCTGAGANFQLCGANSECVVGTPTCTPTRALNSAKNGVTQTVIDVCQ